MFDGMAEGQRFHCYWTEKLTDHLAAHRYSELIEGANRPSSSSRRPQRMKSVSDISFIHILDVQLTVGHRAMPNHPIAETIGLNVDSAVDNKDRNDLFVTIYGNMKMTGSLSEIIVSYLVSTGVRSNFQKTQVSMEICDQNGIPLDSKISLGVQDGSDSNKILQNSIKTVVRKHSHTVVLSYW